MPWTFLLNTGIPYRNIENTVTVENFKYRNTVEKIKEYRNTVRKKRQYRKPIREGPAKRFN